MQQNNNKEIKDAEWQQAYTEEGQIKFTKPKEKKIVRRIKFLFKGIAFILIAALSGGATALYVVQQNSVNQSYSPNNASLFQQNEEAVKPVEIPKNAITKVAESVGPTVVGINNLGGELSGKGIMKASGSGIIFDAKGYIVTNAHVIEGSDILTVKLASGKELPAKLIGEDRRSDLAVIKVEAENLPVARFGDSSKVKVGDVAIAIGNPLGEEYAGTVTAGIISAVNRKIQVDDSIYKVLQTDAAINPGNSGGALCNEAGEIVGINSLKISGENNIEGISFAISINEAKGIIKALTETGKVSRPYLGIAGFTANPERNKGVAGVYIQEVARGKGAAEAGIKPTDIIVELDKIKIEKMEDLSEILDKHAIGQIINGKVWRNGKVIEVNITLTERPERS